MKVASLWRLRDDLADLCFYLLVRHHQEKDINRTTVRETASSARADRPSCGSIHPDEETARTALAGGDAAMRGSGAVAEHRGMPFLCGGRREEWTSAILLPRSAVAVR